MEQLSREAIDYATMRLDEFIQVHYLGDSPEGRKEALSIMCDSLGFEKEIRDHLDEWNDEILPGHSGFVLLGFVLALFALQYESES